MQVRPPYHRPLVGTLSLLTLCSIPLNQGKTEVLPVLSTLDGEYSHTLTLSPPGGVGGGHSGVKAVLLQSYCKSLVLNPMI